MTLESAITVIEIGIVHFVRDSPSKSLQPSPLAPLLRRYRPAGKKGKSMNIAQIKKHAIAHKLTDSHDEWLRQRNKGLGGSDAGSVLGLSPYKSPYTLWAEKTGLIDSRIPDNEAMRVGRDLEQYVAERFTEATGLKVQRSGYSFQSKEHPWMLGNVDRLIVGENAGLECKTANALTKTDYSGGDIPAAYYAQCYHYMAVTGADAWYIAILVMGKGFHWFRIERDEDEIEALVAAEKEFWDKVQTKEAPDPDGSDSTSQTLEKLYPESFDEEVELDYMEDTLQEREALEAKIKDLTAQKKELDAQLKEEMKTAQKGICGLYSISWKTQKRTSFDKESYREDHPDEYTDYLKTTTTRPFVVRKRKEVRA